MAVEDDNWAAKNAEEEERRRSQAAKAPDPYGAQRQAETQQGVKLKRFGSTPAERAGAIRGYAPGYGRSNPNNVGPGGSPGISAIPITHMESNALTPAEMGRLTGAPPATAIPPAPTLGGPVVAPAMPAVPQISAVPQFPAPTFTPGQQVGTGTQGVIGSLPPNQFGTGSSFIPLTGAKPAIDPGAMHPVAAAPKLSAVPAA